MQKFLIKRGRAIIFAVTTVTIMSGCISFEVDIDKENLRNSDFNVITPYKMMDADLKLRSKKILVELEWKIEDVNHTLNKTFNGIPTAPNYY